MLPEEKAATWLMAAETAAGEQPPADTAALLAIAGALLAIAAELTALRDEVTAATRAVYNLAGP